MKYKMLLVNETGDTTFVPATALTAFHGENPLTVPRVGEIVHFSGYESGIVIKLDHGVQDDRWVTQVYLRRLQ